MSILIFIGVLVVLILVHEAGHFFAAKACGMRVDEFGLGYPPRIAGKKFGETEYTINALPFGGFVRIFGENEVGVVKGEAGKPKTGAFTEKSRLAQAFVLLAGITMNLIFAWILLTGALLVGTPRALSVAEIPHASNVSLAVGSVLPGSPAERAGIVPGDFIKTAHTKTASWKGADAVAFTKFVSSDKGAPIQISIISNGVNRTVTATPVQGIAPSNPNRFILGVGISPVGILPLSFANAIKTGTAITWELTRETAVGLVSFLAHAVTFSANLSQVSGPIGIASAVGAAASSGLGNIFSLMALISINLALINLIPIPALDGGRLFFVIIEAITRRPIKPRITQLMNAVGFILIIILMVVVTAHDIFRIFG